MITVICLILPITICMFSVGAAPNHRDSQDASGDHGSNTPVPPPVTRVLKPPLLEENSAPKPLDEYVIIDAFDTHFRDVVSNH